MAFFFCVEGTSNWNIYLGLLINLPTQLHEDTNEFMFQQHGAPPHFRYF
jgi:hypothetical protein